jgi:uncharacterized protein (TIGR02186 family)
MRHSKFIVLAVIIMVSALLLPQGAWAKLTARTNHDHVEVDFFYHGSAVSVKGESEPAVEYIIKVTAPESHQALRQKGRVGGVMWMNVGELSVEHAPNLYFVRSTRKLEEMLPPEELHKHLIGYPALEKHVEMTSVSGGSKDAVHAGDWFGEFVKFKEAKRLYNISDGDIVTKADGDGQSYYTLLDWPYQAPPGEYRVDVYAVKDGRIVDTADSVVSVSQVGVVKLMASMARNQGALYGILAIVIAFLAGFAVSMVFRKGGGAH